MAVFLATMTVLKPRCLGLNTPAKYLTCGKTAKRASVLPVKYLTRSFAVLKPCDELVLSNLLGKMATASTAFSVLSYCDSAIAAQQIADIAEVDNRGLAILLPVIPAVLWALYNILGPAINQIQKMRSEKGIIVALGLGGLAASNGFFAPQASAIEIGMINEASRDGQGLLLLAAVAPAILRVLYSILQPALNRSNSMRTG